MYLGRHMNKKKLLLFSSQTHNFIAYINNNLSSIKKSIMNDQGLGKQSSHIDSDRHEESTSSQSLILTKKWGILLIQHGSLGTTFPERVRECVPFWALTFLIPSWSQPKLRRIRTNLLHPLILILPAREQIQACFPYALTQIRCFIYTLYQQHFWVWRGEENPISADVHLRHFLTMGSK